MGNKKNNEGFVYNAFDLLKFVWDKKWILLIISLIAFILSIIVSLNITPRFKSQVILFPAASVSLSKNLVETSAISMDSRDVLSFGEEQEAERMLQILNSNQIKDYIVKKYDLMKHYNINLSSRYPYTQLDQKYKSNIKFRRTEYQSLEINVLDPDPQYAANIANDIASYIDSTIHNIQKERATEAFSLVEKEYNTSQKQIKILSDSIQKIRNLGIVDYESQAASLSNAYANALETGNSSAANALQSKMKVLTRYGGTYIELSKMLESELDRLAQLKIKYAANKMNIEQAVSQVFIVDKATKSEKKDVPKRSIIVLLSTISAFAFSLLVLLIIDNLKSRN